MIIGDTRKTFTEEILTAIGGASLSGNLLVPRGAFEKTGGFDETMEGHGGEDCEFGYHCDVVGAKGLLSERVRGYHVAHTPEPTSGNMDIVRGHIRYVHKKHNIPINAQMP